MKSAKIIMQDPRLEAILYLVYRIFPSLRIC